MERIPLRYRNKDISKRLIPIAAILLILVTLLGPIFTNHVHAMSNFTQSDWSGGVGTDITNQYAQADNIDSSIPNQLKLGSTSYPDWCNTANCDTNWSTRKPITISNTSQTDIHAFSVTSIKITVAYDSAMKSDFSDLRFTNQAGDTDISYFIQSKTNSQTADIFIKLPTDQNTGYAIPSSGLHIYMYFGNAGASSLSSDTGLEFADGFSGGDASRWAYVPSDATVSNNELVTSADSSGSMASGITNSDQSIDHIAEFTFKLDTPADNVHTCPISTSNGNGGYNYSQDFYSPIASTALSNLTLNFFLHCDGATRSFDIANGANSQYDDYPLSQRLNFDTYYHIKVVSPGQDSSNYNGGYPYGQTAFKNSVTHPKILLSSDGGVNYQDISTPISLPNYYPYSMNSMNLSLTVNYIVMHLKDVTQYSQSSLLTPTFGNNQVQTGKTGNLVSASIFMGSTPGVYYGNILSSSSGTGTVQLKVRSTSDGNFSDPADFASCNILNSGDAINSSSCVKFGDRYLQYQVIMDGSDSLMVHSVALEYDIDTTAPSSNVGSITVQRSRYDTSPITDGWINSNAPYFKWNAAQDTGGSGVAGYCLYLGSDQSADVTTTAGVLDVNQMIQYAGIHATDIVDTHGACVTAIRTPELDLSNGSYQRSGFLNSDGTYYLKVLPFDNAGNLAASTTQLVIKLDKSGPQYSGQTLQDIHGINGMPGYSVSGALVNVNAQLGFSWLFQPGDGFVDNSGGGPASGVVGFKYCIEPQLANGPNSLYDCSGSSQSTGSFRTDSWFGSSGQGGLAYNSSDVIPFSAGSFLLSNAAKSRINTTLQPPNNDVNTVNNTIYLYPIDKAGNLGSGIQLSFYANKVDTLAPNNLVATPTSNTQNNFSFNWDPPTAVPDTIPNYNYAHNYYDPTTTTYCWTVNEAIRSDLSNCTWTAAGVTTLPAGPYATKQGDNTLYLLAKDGHGVYTVANTATATFSASTASPGGPSNLIIADSSIRQTGNAPSNWKFTLSWIAPTSGPDVHSYKIFRSTDGTNFTQIGTTSGSTTDYIDSGLQQVDYWYYVESCDNADSCSVPSNTATKKPTGKFAVPANLIGSVQATNISARRATIAWTTDRDSDTEVALGTQSGNYNAGDSITHTQTSSHSIDLANLQPGTTYYYKAKWTDSDGNTGNSTEKTFTTSPAPTIGDVSTTNIGVAKATANFTSNNASKVKIYYGTDELFGKEVDLNTSTSTSTYAIDLPGLNDGTRYVYKINTLDSDGNEYQGNLYYFTTPARPHILNLRFQPITDTPTNTQKVTWTTNVPATTEVSYGPSGATPLEAIDSHLVTDHSALLPNLIDNTQYSLVAISSDATGDSTSSDAQSFRTQLDTRPPAISNISIQPATNGTGSNSKGQITVSWHTDEPASSQVAYGYGQAGPYTNKSTEDAQLVLDHTIVIAGLPVASVYHLQIVTHDKAGNIGLSSDKSAIIGPGSENALDLIINALQRILGI